MLLTTTLRKVRHFSFNLPPCWKKYCRERPCVFHSRPPTDNITYNWIFTRPRPGIGCRYRPQRHWNSPHFFMHSCVVFMCHFITWLSSFRIVPSVEKPPESHPPPHPPVPAVVLTLAFARGGVGWTWCTFQLCRTCRSAMFFCGWRKPSHTSLFLLFSPHLILSVCFLSLHYRIS